MRPSRKVTSTAGAESVKEIDLDNGSDFVPGVEGADNDKHK